MKTQLQWCEGANETALADIVHGRPHPGAAVATPAQGGGQNVVTVLDQGRPGLHRCTDGGLGRPLPRRGNRGQLDDGDVVQRLHCRGGFACRHRLEGYRRQPAWPPAPLPAAR